MSINYVPSRPNPVYQDLSGANPCELMADHAPDMTVLVQPDGRCRHSTAASSWLLGRLPTELAGIALADLATPSDRHLIEGLLTRLGNGEQSAAADFRAQRGDTAIWIEAHGRRLPAGAGAVVSLRDISARKESEAVLEEANGLLRRRATIDIVTGLLNRDHFVATLEREVRRAQREHTELALIALGLNQFRLFNDLYGWEAGDAALRSVADAVLSALHRPSDTAGRLDGDELAILLPSTGAAGATTICERVRGVVAALGIPHAGTSAGIMEAVCGVALASPGGDVAALLRAAHCAMRSAKGEQLGGLLPTPAAAH